MTLTTTSTLADCIETDILERAHGRARELGLEPRLAARLADRELRRVVGRLAREAADEPIDERRGMLEELAVGSLLVEHSAADMARIGRVVDALDPADVRVLREIAARTATPAMRAQNPDWHLADGQARRQTWRASPSREGLMLAGCVHLDDAYAPHIVAPLVIGSRAHILLEVLCAWS